MDIREMHYDFLFKLNKVDSAQRAGLKIPEIDWLLNEAEELVVKRIMHPRRYNGLGFETSQRSIDDLKTIVISDYEILIEDKKAVLPGNYWTFVSAYANCSKGTCKNAELSIFVNQHDDDFKNDSFAKSSFEWRELNVTFSEGNMIVHPSDDFSVNEVVLTYIRTLNYMHNAQDFRGGTYTRPTGEVLTGSSNSNLPDHMHREIVDMAVMLASGQLQTPEYQLHAAKANLNSLIT